MEKHEKVVHQEVNLLESRVGLNGEVLKENEMVEVKIFPWVFPVVCSLDA